jgi:hypothetical protein
VPDPKPNGSDQLDAAIAATEGQKAVVQMEQINVTIASTGRPFAIGIPMDMTEPELLEVIGWMSTNLRIHLGQRRAKGPASRIVLPS